VFFVSIGYIRLFETSKLCLHVKTPFKKYEDVTGLIFYDLDERHIFLSLTGEHFQTSTNVMYLYNNFTNFNLKLEVTTPMNHLSNLAVIAMYNGHDVRKLYCFVYCTRTMR